MERNRIQFIWGYPGSIYYLARRALQQGWNTPLRAVATWGDTLYSHYRTTIETAFQTRVFDQYGIGEGIMISAQCGVGSHYHIFSPDVIVEYLGKDEQPVAEGEVGELVITRLHPGPMPLIRYRVGDVGVSGNSRRCTCGRAFEIQESILGRETDVVITPSGNRLIVHFFTGILEYFNQIDTFQVIQDSPDFIHLHIEPRANATLDQPVINNVIGQLQWRGADIDIRVEVVDTIPMLPNGKRRFVINKLKPVPELTY
jgi:phenylacetate-CoA ligase